MNILDNIVQHKRAEVERQKKEVNVSELEKGFYFDRKTLSLKESLQRGNRTGIIAEFKRRSPSKGIINDRADIIDVTTAYADNGASALSVLTDENFFGGSNEDLVEARINDIPILRKDFVIDEYQLTEAKSIGADVILLIAACLTPKEVKGLAGFAKNLGLEVLLELHDENELEHICDETELIGINNRNLKTFDVNIEQSLLMAEKIPGDKIKIAESGISSVDDIMLFKENGFKGFLIGELFMKEADPTIAFAEFVNTLRIMPPKAEGF
ncbi:MAG TPA: indole-3-glycerol phosphate synthase TrpC [Chitinophagaceae bacterium]|jgi:indole-3-glycerol phosphate synthase|nr:indole-3-glycerol phosphate synthase TrpC [Chitinophagaceae bacterium]